MEKRGRLPGLILVALGSFFLLSNNGYLSGEYSLVFLGAAFIAGYVLTGRRVGLLIAGCMVSTVGLYALLEESILPRDSGGIFLIMLGIAFFLVFGVHTAHQTDQLGRSRYWPLYPGTALTLIGVMTSASENWYWGNLMKHWWPAAIVALGCLMLYRNRPVDR